MHIHTAFIDGVNTNNHETFDDKLNEEVAKHRSTQRRIEREIVKYKKSLMVAEEMNSDTASYYEMLVRRRQKAMRKHLSNNGEYLTRQYERERVYVPLETLMKDYQ